MLRLVYILNVKNPNTDQTLAEDLSEVQSSTKNFLTRHSKTDPQGLLLNQLISMFPYELPFAHDFSITHDWNNEFKVKALFSLCDKTKVLKEPKVLEPGNPYTYVSLREIIIE